MQRSVENLERITRKLFTSVISAHKCELFFTAVVRLQMIIGRGFGMDFPWDALGTIVGISLIFLLILLSPYILGALIGQILRFFRNLFGGDDDE